MDQVEKACRECQVVRPLVDFPTRKDQRDGHHWWCYECKRAKDRAYGAVYRARNPEHSRSQKRKYNRKDDVRERQSHRNLQEKYGLTREAYDAKLAAQGDRCPFCAVDDDTPKTYDVDHDHACCPGSRTCGKCLRDILCHRHNLGLGFWNDDPELLRAAADYIERWRLKILPPES